MIYNNFAYVYDDLMDVDYIRWVDFLEKIYEKYKVNPSLVLELACGTGNISIELAKRGYEIIGIDISLDMLSVAKEKALQQEQEILFLYQDMTNFELYGTVDSIICCMDAVNYVVNPKALKRMFRLVQNYLNSDGLFIFDIRSEYALSQVVGENTFVEDNEYISYIWQNHFDIKKKISTMDLTVFAKQGNLYKKFNEVHKLKCYSIEEISDILQDAGLKLLGVFDNLQLKKPGNASDRIFFVSKKI